MRMVLVALILLAVVFATDSPDRREIGGQVAGSDAEYTESGPMEKLSTGRPHLELICPDCAGLDPAIVPPSSPFRWQSIDGMVRPDSVRWIIVSTDRFNWEVVYFLPN